MCSFQITATQNILYFAEDLYAITKHKCLPLLHTPAINVTLSTRERLRWFTFCKCIRLDAVHYWWTGTWSPLRRCSDDVMIRTLEGHRTQYSREKSAIHKSSSTYYIRQWIATYVFRVPTTLLAERLCPSFHIRQSFPKLIYS